jgi:hypothetical protein
MTRLATLSCFFRQRLCFFLEAAFNFPTIMQPSEPLIRMEPNNLFNEVVILLHRCEQILSWVTGIDALEWLMQHHPVPPETGKLYKIARNNRTACLEG